MTNLEDIKSCYKCGNKKLEYHSSNMETIVYYNFINGTIGDKLDSNITEDDNDNKCIYCPFCEQIIFTAITTFKEIE